MTNLLPYDIIQVSNGKEIFVINSVDKLYKRIMKHDPKVVDDIQTLDEAKEIIKMITGNVYLNGEIYEILKEEK